MQIFPNSILTSPIPPSYYLSAIKTQIFSEVKNGNFNVYDKIGKIQRDCQVIT